MIPHADIFIRFLTFILSTEAAIRYAFWYAKVRRKPPEPMRELILGICIGHAGIAASAAHLLSTIIIFRAAVWADIPQQSSGMTYIVGSFLCLIPCWRISCQASTAQIIANVVIRLGLAYIGAVILGVTFL